eukprot:1140593-Pelagomonas_calceolata.AAC.6
MERGKGITINTVRNKKKRSTPVQRPRALRKGSLTSKLAKASPRAFKPKLDTASLGYSQKQR